MIANFKGEIIDFEKILLGLDRQKKYTPSFSTPSEAPPPNKIFIPQHSPKATPTLTTPSPSSRLLVLWHGWNTPLLLIGWNKVVRFGPRHFICFHVCVQSSDHWYWIWKTEKWIRIDKCGFKYLTIIVYRNPGIPSELRVQQLSLCDNSTKRINNESIYIKSPEKVQRRNMEKKKKHFHFLNNIFLLKWNALTSNYWVKEFPFRNWCSWAAGSHTGKSVTASSRNPNASSHSRLRQKKGSNYFHYVSRVSLSDTAQRWGKKLRKKKVWSAISSKITPNTGGKGFGSGAE